MLSPSTRCSKTNSSSKEATLKTEESSNLQAFVRILVFIKPIPQYYNPRYSCKHYGSRWKIRKRKSCCGPQLNVVEKYCLWEFTFVYSWSLVRRKTCDNVPNVSFSTQVVRQDQENEHLWAAKAKFSKNAKPRAALGDLGNRPNTAFAGKVRKPLLNCSIHLELLEFTSYKWSNLTGVVLTESFFF